MHEGWLVVLVVQVPMCKCPYRNAQPPPLSCWRMQHFGRQVISGILGLALDHPELEAVYLQVGERSHDSTCWKT